MAVIEFEHVSKAYHLGAGRTSLREAITQLPRKLFSHNGAQTNDQLFWALNDVSFRVEPGEVLGIIGPNGAGKSTILKLLSKVAYPTSGHIRTQGRLAALIELGAGFHSDLSGRENIYLNGSILGLKKQEIDAQLSNIVEFSGLEKFIDTPIKRYSSGMYVRLAFAVAAHVKAELLLVDEVLSVGDMTFQQKCLAKMNELRDSGVTIIFISHNLPAVQSFCDRVLLLHSGRIAANGNFSDVLQTYKQLEQETREAALMRAEAQGDGVVLSLEDTNGTPDTALITKVELLNSVGQPSCEFKPTDGLMVRCHYDIPHEIEQPVYMIRVRRRADSFICFTMYMGDPIRFSLQGQGAFEARINQLLLVPGRYMLETNIHSYGSNSAVVGLPEPFSVTGSLRADDAGIYEPNMNWSFNLTESEPVPVDYYSK
jgi:lipopolysaccharide transport system ATP-binding protein